MPVDDAGRTSLAAREAQQRRIEQTDGKLISNVQMYCELQRDWAKVVLRAKRPESTVKSTRKCSNSRRAVIKDHGLGFRSISDIHWFKRRSLGPILLNMNTPLPDGIHVLLIDDDPGIQDMISDYLNDNEIRVTNLTSGRGIGDALFRECIDLVILDRKLPGEDGMQIVLKLREASTIPVLILTELKEEADRVMGLELGADDYLTKPFYPRELLARIRALMRRAGTCESIVNELSRIHYYRFSGWEVSARLRSATLPTMETGLISPMRNTICLLPSSPHLSACQPVISS